MHLCIDMQNLFAEDTPWRTPWMARVLPAVMELARHDPARTVFTRFIPPAVPEEAQGTWRRYFERWRELTRQNIDPDLLALVPPLAALVPPAAVMDKPGYSAFHRTPLRERLRQRGIDTVVLSGVETDVCVLATVFAAMDYGLRVIVAGDAICSSSDQTHDGLMQLYSTRFGQQVESAVVENILRQWPPRLR